VLWVYILFGLGFFALPVILRFCAEDSPRNDDGDSEPALVT
jgi:hypothetical protein